MIAHIINLNCIAIILLWQTILSSFVYGNHEILETTIKDGNTEIHLRWQKTKQLLSNVHMPVWLVNSLYGEVPHLLPQNFIEDNIGEFVMYHDLRKCSAVVYFKKRDALYGIIDTRYIINGIPMSQLRLIHSIGPYVKMTSQSKNDVDHKKTVKTSKLHEDEYFMNTKKLAPPVQLSTIKKRFRPDPSNQQTITNLYPEVLIIVPTDVLEMIKTKEPSYIEIIIRDHITIFNAIDMMMAKLSTHDIKIYLNIAGIIIDQGKVFTLPTIDLSLRANDTISFETYYGVETDISMSHFELFLSTHRETFLPDSFDFYYASTTKQLSLTGSFINGLSKRTDVYSQKVSGKDYPQLQGLFIQRGYAYDHVIAAHEMGHLLGLEHNPFQSEFSDFYNECSNIMKPFGGYCPECSEWNIASATELRNFIRQDRNHCVLLNKPRSLHLHGQVMKTLSPADQCRCYGFKPRAPNKYTNYSNVIPPSRCNKNLMCNSNDFRTPLPFDGTPCGDNKVCWNLKCKKIEIEV